MLQENDIASELGLWLVQDWNNMDDSNLCQVNT